MATLHAESSLYNVNSFKKRITSLNNIEIEELGNIKGKKLLQLQCYFDVDILSLARAGSEAVGVDISDTSIQIATELFSDLKILAKFISSIYMILKVF